MGRIRTIKPEFWKHEELSALSESAHMLAAALLNYADDDGYFNANPRLVQAECFPLRELSSSVPVLLQELSRIGYLRLGLGSDGKTYGHILSFRNHQVISHYKESKISKMEVSWRSTGGVLEPSILNGMEGKGIEQGMEGKGEPSANADSPPQIRLAVDAYNETAGLVGIPQCQRLTEKRRKALKARLRDAGGIEGWGAALGKLSESSFCRGKNDRGWTADFDFLLQESSFTRLMEGYYDDKCNSTGSIRDSWQQADEYLRRGAEGGSDDNFGLSRLQERPTGISGPSDPDVAVLPGGDFGEVVRLADRLGGKVQVPPDTG